MGQSTEARALLLEHYLEVAPNAELGWVYRDRPVFEHAETSIALQAIALLLAMKASNDVTPGNPRRERLDEIAARMGTEVVIRRRDAASPDPA